MKRFLAILMVMNMMGLFSACGENPDESSMSQAPTTSSSKTESVTEQENAAVFETEQESKAVIEPDVESEPVIEEETEVYMMEVCPPYSSHNLEEYFSGDYFSMAGEDYSNGFIFTHTQESVAYFNLKGQYDTMKLELGMVSEDYPYDDVFIVSFIVDNKTVATYKMDRNVMPQEITVPLNYGKQLKICTSENWDMKVGFAEIKLEK